MQGPPILKPARQWCQPNCACQGKFFLPRKHYFSKGISNTKINNAADFLNKVKPTYSNEAHKQAKKGNSSKLSNGIIILGIR